MTNNIPQVIQETVPSVNENVDNTAIVDVSTTQTALVTEKVDSALVEKTVKFISEKVSETIYKGSLEIGEYVLKNFFKDSIEFAACKNPHKPASFRALCKHPKLAVHPSTLSQMVRVAHQERFFKHNSIGAKQLNYTQRCILIKLPDNEEKIATTKEIIEKGLSTRETLKLVLERRPKISGNSKNELLETFEPTQLLEELVGIKEQTNKIADILIPKDLLQHKEIAEFSPQERQSLKDETKKTVSGIKQLLLLYQKLLQNIEAVEEK